MNCLVQNSTTDGFSSNCQVDWLDFCSWYSTNPCVPSLCNMTLILLLKVVTYSVTPRIQAGSVLCFGQQTTENDGVPVLRWRLKKPLWASQWRPACQLRTGTGDSPAETDISQHSFPAHHLPLEKKQLFFGITFWGNMWHSDCYTVLLNILANRVPI